MSFVEFIDIWKKVLLRPSVFYKEMPKTGGLIDPILFSIVSLSISAFFYLFLNPKAYVFIDTFSSIPKVAAVLILVIGITSLLIDATVLYFIYKALGGTGTYEGTARFVLYASAAPMFIWIPIIGWIFGIYQFYLYTLGGKYVHNISMEKSALAILILISLSFVFGIILCLLSKA